MLVRKLQQDKSLMSCFFKNMDLFLECVFMLLPGVADSLDYSLQLDITACL